MKRPTKRKIDSRPPKSARAAALMALVDTDKGRFPEDALEEYGRGLDGRDRALASSLVYGTLRRQSLLDWTLGHFLKNPQKPLPPNVNNNLRIGLFQMMYQDRIPVAAAVNESVELARQYGPAWSTKLVNAVLRAASRVKDWPDPGQAELTPEMTLAIRESHPNWMVERWVRDLGLDETADLLQANNRQPPLSLRVNTRKTTPEDMITLLTEHGLDAEKAKYAPAGVLINGPTGPITGLPGYGEGWFAVQDEAAQIVGLLCETRPGARILDACAGRGGKLLHLAETDGVMVFGLDPDPGRLKQIPSEARRLGRDNWRLAVGDVLNSPFPPKSFDVVLVDAPCSNLGVIRRRPDVKWSKSPTDPADMAGIQIQLLNAAAEMVRPGGRLVYAVCTLTTEETTGVTDAFWMNHLEFGLFPANTYLPESARALVAEDGVIRAWPHRHDTDGFFAAVFERKVDKPPDFF